MKTQKNNNIFELPKKIVTWFYNLIDGVVLFGSIGGALIALIATVVFGILGIMFLFLVLCLGISLILIAIGAIVIVFILGIVVAVVGIVVGIYLLPIAATYYIYPMVTGNSPDFLVCLLIGALWTALLAFGLVRNGDVKIMIKEKISRLKTNLMIRSR